MEKGRKMQVKMRRFRPSNQHSMAVVGESLHLAYGITICFVPNSRVDDWDMKDSVKVLLH